MANAGLLKRVGYGWYTLPQPPGGGIDLRIENVCLVSKSNAVIPQGGRAAPSIKAYQSRIDVLTRRAKMPGWQGADKTDLRTFFKVYPVYVQEFDGGTVTVQVGAAKGGPSLSMLDFIEFCGWLQGHFESIPDDGPTGWYVRTYELNHDFDNLRMDGARAVTLRVFRNVLVKFYQKRAALRVEVKPTQVDLPLSQLHQFAADLARQYLRAGLVEVQEIREGEP